MLRLDYTKPAFGLQAPWFGLFDQEQSPCNEPFGADPPWS